MDCRFSTALFQVNRNGFSSWIVKAMSSNRQNNIERVKKRAEGVYFSEILIKSVHENDCIIHCKYRYVSKSFLL